MEVREQYSLSEPPPVFAVNALLAFASGADLKSSDVRCGLERETQIVYERMYGGSGKDTSSSNEMSTEAVCENDPTCHSSGVSGLNGIRNGRKGCNTAMDGTDNDKVDTLGVQERHLSLSCASRSSHCKFETGDSFLDKKLYGRVEKRSHKKVSNAGKDNLTVRQYLADSCEVAKEGKNVMAKEAFVLSPTSTIPEQETAVHGIETEEAEITPTEVVSRSEDKADIEQEVTGKGTGEESLKSGVRSEEEIKAAVREALKQEEGKGWYMRCLCRTTEEEGMMVLCDQCGFWLHGRCLGITDEKEVTGKYSCPFCEKRNVRRAKSKSASTNKESERGGVEKTIRRRGRKTRKRTPKKKITWTNEDDESIVELVKIWAGQKEFLRNRFIVGHFKAEKKEVDIPSVRSRIAQLRREGRFDNKSK